MSVNKFQLLLQDPDDGDAFGEGIDNIEGERGEAGERAVKPEKQSLNLLTNAKLNSLSQGWGVLYPEGRGDLLDAVRPLMKHREAQVQVAWEDEDTDGDPPAVQSWAIPKGWKGSDFILQIYDRMDFFDKPYYVLILGDLDGISLDFQLDIAGRVAVGRLCFPDIGGYERYVKKIIANEQAVAEYRVPRLLLFSPSNPDPMLRDAAVDNGHQHLIEATRGHVVDLKDSRTPFSSDRVLLTGPRAGDAALQSWGGLAGLAGQAHPSVLLTLSHGAGRSRWKLDEQRANQGGLKLGRRETLDPNTLTEGPFLPGGAWFLYACFGAGTPDHTAYDGFLSDLYRAGNYSFVPDVMKTLSKGAPFIARTPMAALSNPEGPLAVFAHADLAFSYAYATLGGQDLITLPAGQGSAANPFEGGKPYIADTLKQLGRGIRAGYAIRELDKVVQFLETLLTGAASMDVNADEALKNILLQLSARPDAEGALPAAVRDAAKAALQKAGHSRAVDLRQIADAAGMSVETMRSSLSAQLVGERFGELERISRSERFMARNDIRAFILLGDPAATLPLEKTRPKRELSVEEMQAQVLGMGFTAPKPAPAPAPTPAPAPAPAPATTPEASPEASPFGDLSVEDAEDLVYDLIIGETPKRQLARDKGLSTRQLDELQRVFTDAGRAALATLLKG